MSWVALFVAAWIGFVVGYVLCGLLSFNSSLWEEADEADHD